MSTSNFFIEASSEAISVLRFSTCNLRVFSLLCNLSTSDLMLENISS